MSNNILHTLIADAEKALAALGEHLVELGHEAETALLAQAKTAAGPLVQAAEGDAAHLAETAAADVAAAATPAAPPAG